MKLALCLGVLLLESLVPSAEEPAASELARVRFESEGGLMLVDVEVERSETLVFLIDSGASTSVLERRIAERLELEMGPERGRSPASSRAELTFRVAPRLAARVGGHGFELKNVIAAPCEGMARMLMGRTVHGILGHDFLSAHTLEVDHVRRELVLHDPKAYRYEGEGAALPLRFVAKHASLPFTKVTLETESGEEVPVEMLVDSGGSILATMGLNSPRVIDAVVPKDARRVAVQGATGLANETEGTMHRTFATRLHRARIGPYAIERPTSSCRPQSYPGIDLFGAAVLRRFHVVFDYEHSRLLLEPNSRFSEPQAVDRSGLFLVASEKGASLRRVFFVSPGTPAEEAGLQRDDVLLEIDGVPADARSLHATREVFFEARRFELKVRRGEEVLELILSTRDLL